MGRKKRRSDITDAVIDIAAGGVAANIGGSVVGQVGALAPAGAAGVTRNAFAGIRLVGAALPVKGANALLKEVEKAGKG